MDEWQEVSCGWIRRKRHFWCSYNTHIYKYTHTLTGKWPCMVTIDTHNGQKSLNLITCLLYLQKVPFFHHILSILLLSSSLAHSQICMRTFTSWLHGTSRSSPHVHSSVANFVCHFLHILLPVHVDSGADCCAKGTQPFTWCPLKQQCIY